MEWRLYILWYDIIIIGDRNDDKAFIFTLKNPHGVEPTRYMKREGSKCAIICDPDCGPIFNYDIIITNNCNEKNSCGIDNKGTYGYECHPEYKSSLLVNTAGPDEDNYFSVLDYEVYCKNDISNGCIYF